MPVLIIAALLTGLFALLGFSGWVILYFLNLRNHGGKVFKVTLITCLCFFPVTLFLVLPITFSHLIANASTRPQDRILTSTPASFGCHFWEIDFPSRDGLLLSGWLIEGKPDKVPIIFSHGLFRDRRELLERAAKLSQHGHSVLIFDLRCHGKSQRKTISLGYQERLDVLGASDFVLDRFGVRRVVVAGVSMGAVASIFAATESPQSVEAIIADSPFDTLVDTVGRHTELFLQIPTRPFSDIFIWNLTREAEFSADQLDTIRAVSTLNELPVLLLYGERDSRMARNVATNLYEAIPTVRKRLLFFENADHGGAFDSAPEEYVDAILGFLSDSQVEFEH